MKTWLKRFAFLYAGYAAFTVLKRQYGLNWLKGLWDLGGYLRGYREYLAKSENPNFKISIRYIYPCLSDRTTTTRIEPTYFFQDAWAASVLSQLKPEHHFDVGSSARTMGIISQFIPTTIVDIRPLEVSLPGLTFLKGSILALPFADGSIGSISSLCVVEHIGLGRYGDPLDPWGSEKAIRELKRVLKVGGSLLLSVPVAPECRVYFNAHRAFTRDYVLEHLGDLLLTEERYIYGKELYDNFDTAKDFGTGLFHFSK